MAKKEDFKTTAEIKVPKKIIDQVIGQEDAVEVMRKAAQQRRHVLLIGEPGTGKSLLGIGLAELLPKEKLVDILAFFNPNDENQPLIRTVPAGKGRELAFRAKMEGMGMFKNQNIFMFVLAIIAMIAPWWIRHEYMKDGAEAASIMFAALFLGGMVFLAAFVIFLNVGKKMGTDKTKVPKLIVDNFKKKQAPFFDATGAHAGALLGDCLHDPFQSFSVVTKFDVIKNKENAFVDVKTELDKHFDKYKTEILKKKERSYEAIFIPKNELSVLGETNGSVSPVEVLSSNRYNHDGEMIKLTTSENKELIVTSEHKVAIWKNEKIEYVEAQDIKEGDEVVSKAEDKYNLDSQAHRDYKTLTSSSIIIDEQDIINTYDKRQQEQCKLYYQYKELKAQNPTWGYKRISKTMGQPEAKTRWWHAGKHIPVPIQTVNWLKEKGLIPLKINNTKLPLVAKVLGATFGDGGIFENLNGIFLSSSNHKDTEEFSNDIQKIFGRTIILNADLREGGEYGHSWCLMNTNRNVIRFFLALGTPKGNKTYKELVVPDWIDFKEEWRDEFYGSLFGSELGVSGSFPRIEFAITGLPHLEKNRLQFMNEIIGYLNSRYINITKRGVDVRPVKTKKGNNENRIYRFILSQTIENLDNFVDKIKINYCNLKKCKLYMAGDRDKRDILLQYLDLRAKGLGAESIMHKLKIDQRYLYKILNNIDVDLEKVEASA